MTPRRQRLVRGLLAFILVLVCVEYLVATVGVQMFEPPGRTDFASYYLAGRLSAQGQDPYDAAALATAGHEIGFDFDQYPFLYPPPFAAWMQPLALLPFETARRVWMLLGTVCLFAALVVTGRLVRWQLQSLQLNDGGVLATAILVPFVAMALNGTAVHNDLRSGSVGAPLFLVGVLVAWTLVRGRRGAAGALLGIAGILKLAPLALVPWLAWRGGRRAVIATLVVLALSLAPVILVSSPVVLWDYLREVVLPAATPAQAWAHNFSLFALVLRLAAVLPLSTAALGIVATALEVGVVVLTLAALRRRAPGPDGTPATAAHGAEAGWALEFGVLFLALLLVMRITWVHTLTSMLFVWPIQLCWIAAFLQAGQRSARRLLGLACLGFFLAGAHLPVLWGERWLTWPWLLAPGLHTAGLLMLWGVGLVLLRRRRQLPGTIGVRLA